MAAQKRPIDAPQLPPAQMPCIDWFEHMPQEVVESILSWIELPAVFAARRTCKWFRDMLRLPYVIGPIIVRWYSGGGTRTSMNGVLLLCDQFPDNKYFQGISDVEASCIRHEHYWNQTNLALLAIRLGDLGRLQYVLDHGLSVNAQNGMHDTLLIYSVERGHVLSAEELLKRRASVNIRDLRGRTPLMQCALIPRPREMIHLLLRHKPAGILDAMEYAGREKKEEMFDILCNHVSVGDRTTTGANALIIAAKYGTAQSVARFIDAGYPLEDADRCGYTALSWASDSGRLSNVCMLLRRGASLETRTLLGSTPLIMAAAGGFKDIVCTLLSHDAPIDAVSVAGLTALMFAVINDKFDVVQILLHFGASVTITDVEHVTPLMLSGCVQISSLLIRHGADINAVDNAGKTALVHALEHDYIGVSSMMLGVSSMLLDADTAATSPPASYEMARQVARRKGLDELAARIAAKMESAAHI